jgi:hypothetical protein
MAGTTYSTGVSWSLAADKGSAPKETPEALVHTRAVETKAGWVGQVIVGGAIVWESAALPGTASNAGYDAQAEANMKVVEVFTNLFVV